MKRKIKKTNSEISIFECFGFFVTEKEASGISASTLRNYKLSFKVFMEYNGFDEATETTELSQTLIYQFTNHLRKSEIRPTSANHYLRDLRTFFNWMTNHHYLDSLEEPIVIKELKIQEELPKMFTEEDLEKLIAKPRNNSTFVEWRTWAIVNTVLAMGARASTICNLKIEDVNFKNKEIALQYQKNKKVSVVPLSSSLETVLREYTKKWGLTTYLFPNVADEPLNQNALSHAFSKYCTDRGVAQTNIHGLRHNFARQWIKSGGSPIKLERILNHSSITMTNHYVKLFSDDLKEDYDDFSALDVIKQKSKRTSKFKKA